MNVSPGPPAIVVLSRVTIGNPAKLIACDGKYVIEYVNVWEFESVLDSTILLVKLLIKARFDEVPTVDVTNVPLLSVAIKILDADTFDVVLESSAEIITRPLFSVPIFEDVVLGMVMVPLAEKKPSETWRVARPTAGIGPAGLTMPDTVVLDIPNESLLRRNIPYPSETCILPLTSSV
jgi:hypothetical protein